jgi:hypothetical protein
MQINDSDIIVTGRFIKIAMFKSEWFQEFGNSVPIIDELRQSKIKADIFTFIERPPIAKPKYDYYMEWDDVAALHITSFDHWWENQINCKTRNMVRKTEKMSAYVRTIDFSDDLVHGIHSIYNETPIRQLKPFPHYGKNFEATKQEISPYLDKSDFIGAYYNEELIGIAKLIHSGAISRLVTILSKNCHRDKAPTNALLAKAVEICANKRIPYLAYGRYTHGKRGNPTLTDFKHHNGFEKLVYPRYFIPLTLKGKIALRFNLHHSLIELLPQKIVTLLIHLRNNMYEKKASKLYNRLK